MKQEKAGAGILIKEDNGMEHKISLRLENGINCRTAEFLAVREAVEILKNKYGNDHAVIRTDSRATIWQLENEETRVKIIAEVQRLLRDRDSKGLSTEIAWAKRMTTEEMVKADKLAKEATEKAQVERHGQGWISKTTARKEKKKWILDKWQRHWDGCETGRNTHKHCKVVGFERLELNRKAMQMITNHGNMEAYLKRFRLKETDGMCDCSRVQEDSDHIMNDCEKSR